MLRRRDEVKKTETNRVVLESIKSVLEPTNNRGASVWRKYKGNKKELPFMLKRRIEEGKNKNKNESSSAEIYYVCAGFYE